MGGCNALPLFTPMREAYFITKETIKKVYQPTGKENVLLHKDPSKQVASTTWALNLNGLGEEVEVTVVSRNGPYAVAQMMIANNPYFLATAEELLVKRSVPEAIDIVKPMLDKEYPGRWYYDALHQLLYLWFPELTLTNSLGAKHKMYDMLVQVVLTRTGYLGAEIRGTRASLTPKEMAVGFRHSHLRSSQTRSFAPFCLGGASTFSNFLSSTRYTPVTQFTLSMFLLQLKEYLSWESLEGGPHMLMSNLQRQEGALPRSLFINLLNPEQREKAAVILLELIVEKQMGYLLTRATSGYYLNTGSLYATDLYKLEKEMVDRLQLPNSLLVPYDETSYRYDTIRGAGLVLPTRDSTVTMLIQELNIKEEIKPDEDQEVSKTNTLRLPTNDLNAIITLVNYILIDGNQ